MKPYENPELVYLGSENPDGTITEALADALDAAQDLTTYRDSEGTRHFFDRITQEQKQ